MNKNTLIKILLVFIVFFIGWLIYLNVVQENAGQEALVQQKVEETEKTENTVFLIIDNGEEIESFEYKFKESLTVFDLLRIKTEEFNIELDFQASDMGIFVNAIGNKKGGNNNKYWLYYVNGEIPMVAVDKQELYSNDTVEFKFQESIF